MNYLIGVRGIPLVPGAQKVPKVFKSGKDNGFSLTKEIKIFEAHAFGDILRPKLNLFDNPGIGAIDLSMFDIIKDLKVSIGH